MLHKHDFQHFQPQASGSAKMNSRSWIFIIFGQGSRSLIFKIFGHRRQDQRKCFSTFSATSARITANDYQKLDFQHFRLQAPGSAKMGSRSPIFSIFDHRCQDQRKWVPEARFSTFSATGVRISENGLQKFDYHNFSQQVPGSTKLGSRSSIFSIFGHRRQDQRK